MQSEPSRGPGVKVPPPLIYLLGLVAGLGLDWLWPTSLLPVPWGYVLGSILVLLSIPIAVAATVRFRKASTTFNVNRAASNLITGGPYRFSRNPAYVSLTMLYLGVGLLSDSGWVLALAAPVLLVMDRWVIRREERHLESVFGEAYLQYKTTVRRWL